MTGGITHGSAAGPVARGSGLPTANRVMIASNSVRLNGAGLAVVAFGHIEDDGMGVELRSNVTIDRAGGVVFELGSNKFGRGFRRMVSANTGLRIFFKLLKRNAHTLAVGQTHVVVAANKCGE